MCDIPGDSTVGKSSLLRSFTDGKLITIFVDNNLPYSFSRDQLALGGKMTYVPVQDKLRRK